MSIVYERFKNYIQLSIAVTFGTLGIFWSIYKSFELLQLNPIKFSFSILLVVTTGVWYFLYYHAVQNELDLLNSAFETKNLKLIPGPVLPIGIPIAILFASLIAFCFDIVIYAGIATLLKIFDIWGTSVLQTNIAKLFQGRVFKDAREADILFTYYFISSMNLRNCLLLVIFLVLSILSYFLHNTMYEYVVYGIIIGSIGISEYVIYRWRKVRDMRLSSNK